MTARQLAAPLHTLGRGSVTLDAAARSLAGLINVVFAILTLHLPIYLRIIVSLRLSSSALGCLLVLRGIQCNEDGNYSGHAAGLPVVQIYDSRTTESRRCCAVFAVINLIGHAVTSIA